MRFSICELIIAIVILVVSLDPSLFGADISNWIVIVAAVILIFHTFFCKKCKMCGVESVPKKRK